MRDRSASAARPIGVGCATVASPSAPGVSRRSAGPGSVRCSAI